MSKIICDVCGTSYPETAAQCPICGCARPVEVRSTVKGDGEAASSGYTYVKGGRFSKANVRKRNMAMQAAAGGNGSGEDPDNAGKKNKLLVITAIVLIAAILAVIIYITVQFFNPFGGQNPVATEPSASETQPNESTEDTTEPTQPDIPCTSVAVSKPEIQLDSVGASYLLEVTANPVDTTDVLYFASSDENVAIVSDDGMVTAVGAGEAEITVTCGEFQDVCKVICNIETEPPTEETTEPTEETTEPLVEGTLELNRKDFTMFVKGDSWNLYEGELDVEAITWTSDNENIATVENGKVVAVGSGMTTVYAEYNGQKVSCIVRCEFPSSSGTGGVTQEGGSGTYKISSEDVTIAVGESFTLTLSDASGNTVNVNWSVSNSGICSVSGNTVTGVASGTAVIEITYEGSYYSCIVRVK